MGKCLPGYTLMHTGVKEGPHRAGVTLALHNRKKERIRILRGLRNQVPPSRPSRATGAALDHVAAFLFRTRPAEAEFITREQPSRFVPFFDCKYNLSKFLQCPESGNLPQPTPPNRDAWVSHSA